MRLRVRESRSELSLLDDVRKYLAYVFDRRSFVPALTERPVSERALQAAATIRGPDREAAIIVHGIMPRAGTVYVGELLRLHPDIIAYPGAIWETPLLQLADEVTDLQHAFLRAYRHNVGKLDEGDFLALTGAAFLAYLGISVPAEKRILLKVPGVQHLGDFYTMFPYEKLLVVTRDGRDVVHSTRKTWPQITFGMACRRWKRSAQMVLGCDQHFSARDESHWLTRFEDAVNDPAGFVHQACEQLNLDVGSYPFQRIGEVAVRGSSSLQEEGNVDWEPREKPQDFDPTGHWRDWSWFRKSTFKRIAGRELMRLGYSEDSDW